MSLQLLPVWRATRGAYDAVIRTERFQEVFVLVLDMHFGAEITGTGVIDVADRWFARPSLPTFMSPGSAI